MTPLRERVIADLKLAGYVQDTQRRYFRTIQCFAEFHNKSPEQLGQDEVRLWVEHLTAVKDRNILMNISS